MRILFFVHSLGRTRHFKDVLVGLTAHGHTVVLATAGRTRPQRSRKGFYDSRGIEVVSCPRTRTDGWEDVAAWLRHGRDRVRYFDPRYADAAKLAARAQASTPKSWDRAFAQHPWLTRHWRVTQRALAWAETLIPCDPGLLRFVRDQAPDLVLVTPLVEFGSYQTDYVKCAHRLGVPVAYLPFSWDNLTNRGLIRVPPDRVLVWNVHQQREALELHRIDADRVVVTGAPRFDAFFRMHSSTTRREFCAPLGLDPERPLVLYLCSSGFVAPREVEFVRRWVGALSDAPRGSWLRSGQVLVRPHPSYLEEWTTADLSDLPGVAVWLQHSTMNADRHLFDSLAHSTAVVGLNTSAMIEAAIVGRPVYTITAPEFAGGQGGTIHFHYLLAGNGGIVSVAGDFAEHCRQLSAAPEVTRETAERSRRFLRDFVRPRGLDTPASDVMVDELERAGALRKRPARVPVWHRPLRRALEAAVRTQIART